MRRINVSPPTTLPPGEERLVRQRLRTIIHLAITIGRREGLISGGMPVEGNCAESTAESHKGVPRDTEAQDSSETLPQQRDSLQ